MTTIEPEHDANAVKALMSAKAVRLRCEQIFAARGDLAHFTVHCNRLDAAADYVIDTIRKNYPDLKIPFHARWRHFDIAGVDRWARLSDTLDVEPDERARIRFDLAVTSVLLDAGAGSHWRYRDAFTESTVARSEGLALASIDAFTNGFFSSHSSEPLMADADGLAAITSDRLGDAFQVSRDNPLEGLEGRTDLMNRLSEALRDNSAYFPGAVPRVGNLFNRIAEEHPKTIEAPKLLEFVLKGFGPIWSGRLEVSGFNLGDTWHHPQVETNDATTGLVPFHKLSQWLTYSLIEPLEEVGIAVTNIDGLTGLAEYRNGGLFIDRGVLEVRDPSVLDKPHAPESELVVEWRALTVALLDRVAEIVRQKLGFTSETLPLASILEGGTWAAGRRAAAEQRAGGEPPITIVSDGSVF